MKEIMKEALEFYFYFFGGLIAMLCIGSVAVVFLIKFLVFIWGLL